jgi:hypothetical protein
MQHDSDSSGSIQRIETHKWCSYCQKHDHDDAECWCTRAAGSRYPLTHAATFPTAEPPAQGAAQDEVSSGSLGASGAEAGRRGARPTKIGFMDGLDWQHHVEHDAFGVRVYPDVKSTLAKESCARKCGVVRVKMIELDWPLEQTLYSEPDAAAPVEAASEAPSQPQASERELPPLQGGMSNDELRAALRAKLPAGAYPEDQWLTPFALGVEVGAARAQEPDQDEPSADARDA